MGEVYPKSNKLEWLVQCAPAFFLGLRWKGLMAKEVLCGLIVGCLWLTYFAIVGGGS